MGSPDAERAASPLIEIRGLKTTFRTDRGPLHAVDGVSLAIFPGETLGLVGESGCGKSVTALSILRLIPRPPGEITAGEILYRGEDLLGLDEAEMRRIRGNRISMIFQEPMTSLNPVFTVGDQIAEAIRLHQGLRGRELRDRTVEMLKLVRIADPERRVRDYPGQMSGGMRQRVMIAIALACRPELLIADEPTTALDVTIQAQILDLLAQLREELGMALLLITHDLGVVAEIADGVRVMYAGRIVEESSVWDLFPKPLHPYTMGLIASLPGLDEKRDRLQAIPGAVPDPLALPSGCRFRDRCGHAFERCAAEEPELFEVAPGRAVRCFLYAAPAGASRDLEVRSVEARP